MIDRIIWFIMIHFWWLYQFLSSYHHHITIIISPLYYSIGYIFCIPIPISPENPIKIDLRKPTPIWSSNKCPSAGDLARRQEALQSAAGVLRRVRKPNDKWGRLGRLVKVKWKMKQQPEKYSGFWLGDRTWRYPWDVSWKYMGYSIL